MLRLYLPVSVSRLRGCVVVDLSSGCVWCESLSPLSCFFLVSSASLSFAGPLQVHPVLFAASFGPVLSLWSPLCPVSLCLSCLPRLSGWGRLILGSFVVGPLGGDLSTPAGNCPVSGGGSVCAWCEFWSCPSVAASSCVVSSPPLRVRPPWCGCWSCIVLWPSSPSPVPQPLPCTYSLPPSSWLPIFLLLGYLPSLPRPLCNPAAVLPLSSLGQYLPLLLLSHLGLLCQCLCFALNSLRPVNDQVVCAGGGLSGRKWFVGVNVLLASSPSSGSPCLLLSPPSLVIILVLVASPSPPLQSGYS